MTAPVALANVAMPGGITIVTPDNANLLVSDYAGISTRSPITLQFLRPFTIAGYNFQNASPGSRVGFITRANNVYFALTFNTLVNYPGNTFGLRASVRVDGVYVGYIDRPTASNVASAGTWQLPLDGATHTVELIWPGATGMELNQIGIDVGTISLPGARPTKRFATYGDSIATTFSVASILDHWSFRLAEAMGYQLINMGHGSGTTQDMNGSDLAGLQLDAIAEELGYNDFYYQTTITNYKANKLAMWQTMRTLYPDAFIICQSVLNSPNVYPTNTNPGASFQGQLSAYRAAVEAEFATWGDKKSILIKGASVLEQLPQLFASDSIHPNETGSPLMGIAYQAYLPNGDIN